MIALYLLDELLELFRGNRRLLYEYCYMICLKKQVGSAILSIILLVSFSVDCISQPHSQKAAMHSLQSKITSILDVPELKTGFTGIEIQRLSNHTTLFSHYADKVFLPASNNKLLTSCAAIYSLGMNWTYITKLMASTAIDSSGLLNGNLDLVGSGDPTLTDKDITALAEEAVKKGLRRVTGTLYYDDSLFDEQYLGQTWAWDDEPYYYSAEISALNCNENVMQITCKPAKVGQPVETFITPLAHYLKVVNLSTTGKDKSTNSLDFTRIEGHNEIIITGSLPVDTPETSYPVFTSTFKNPPLFTAMLMANALQKAGVILDNPPPIKISSGVKESFTIGQHTSQPLSVILSLMNKPSDNLIAECLLKTVGAKETGKGTGNLDGTGCMTARKIFENIGLKMDELCQTDGSGLSRTNFVSPRNIIRILTYLYSRPDFPKFYHSLPVAGVDGTLAYRMKTGSAYDNCRAKTGYVSHVSAISGFVKDKDGDLLVFSILMNNHLCDDEVCQAVQDKIIELLANYTDKDS